MGWSVVCDCGIPVSYSLTYKLTWTMESTWAFVTIWCPLSVKVLRPFVVGQSTTWFKQYLLLNDRVEFYQTWHEWSFDGPLSKVLNDLNSMQNFWLQLQPKGKKNFWTTGVEHWYVVWVYRRPLQSLLKLCPWGHKWSGCWVHVVDIGLYSETKTLLQILLQMKNGPMCLVKCIA